MLLESWIEMHQKLNENKIKNNTNLPFLATTIFRGNSYYF